MLNLPPFLLIFNFQLSTFNSLSSKLLSGKQIICLNVIGGVKFFLMLYNGSANSSRAVFLLLHVTNLIVGVKNGVKILLSEFVV